MNKGLKIFLMGLGAVAGVVILFYLYLLITA